MKKLLFILALLVSTYSYAQITIFQAEYSAIKIGDVPFSDWNPDNSVIIVDFYEQSVTVISRDTTEYSIISQGIPSDADKAVKLEFQALEGRETLYLEFVVFKTQEIRHLYIRKKGRQIVYQMRKL